MKCIRFTKKKLFFLLFLACLLKWPNPGYSFNVADVKEVVVDLGWAWELYEVGLFPITPAYITIAPHVFIDKRFPWNENAKAHEYIHFEQQMKEGLLFYIKYASYWIYYFVRYAWKYRKSEQPFFIARWKAYQNIPYEREAYCVSDKILCP